jgi:hypothetical protein
VNEKRRFCLETSPAPIPYLSLNLVCSLSSLLWFNDPGKTKIQRNGTPDYILFHVRTFFEKLRYEIWQKNINLMEFENPTSLGFWFLLFISLLLLLAIIFEGIEIRDLLWIRNSKNTHSYRIIFHGEQRKVKHVPMKFMFD